MFLCKVHVPIWILDFNIRKIWSIILDNFDHSSFDWSVEKPNPWRVFASSFNAFHLYSFRIQLFFSYSLGKSIQNGVSYKSVTGNELRNHLVGTTKERSDNHREEITFEMAVFMTWGLSIFNVAKDTLVINKLSPVTTPSFSLSTRKKKKLPFRTRSLTKYKSHHSVSFIKTEFCK